jgi:mono/diheme cytochrome c family protein
MRPRSLFTALFLSLFLFLFFGNFAVADTPPLRDATRGELLYANHCIACHTVDIHWRDQKLVSNPSSLRAQILRWQALSGLAWDSDDIAEVARYLNALHYHYPIQD